MTQLWSDGFDAYTTGSDVALRYAPFVSATLNNAANTAFNLGQAVSGFGFSKAWETASNETTVYFSVRTKFNTPVTNAGQTFSMTFQDGTNNQVTIVWAGDGSITVRSGGLTGTVLATYPSVFTLNVWDSWQGKIVHNTATGSVELRKNGAAAATFGPLTSVNTQAGSGNAYSNIVALAGSSNWLIDDLWFNNGDATNPTGWPPDVRACMQYPNGAGSSTQFSPNQATITYGNSNAITGTLWAANTFISVPFTTTASGVITAFTLDLQSGFTGHIIGGVYDNTGFGGTPGALIGTTSIITNPTSGVKTFALSSPTSLTLAKNTTYFIGVLADTGFTALGSTAGSGAYGQLQSYGAGLPNPAVANSTGPAPCMQVVLTPFNWSLVNEPQEDGDSSYVADNNVGDEDLYTLSALPVTPTSILGVRPMVYWRKSDAGSRSGSLRFIANGSSDTDEGTIPLSNNYTYETKFLALDPTAAAWTLTHVNGAVIGVKVAA